MNIVHKAIGWILTLAISVTMGVLIFKENTFAGVLFTFWATWLHLEATDRDD